MTLQLQPVQVATGSADQDSRLVFHNGYLVAILVRLSADHQEDEGKWFMEAGFGRIDAPSVPLFSGLDEAQAWILDQLTEADQHR